MNDPPLFERLSAHHDRESFDCGKPPLNDFLKRQARQNADRNVGVTHVAVQNLGDSEILGYYTLVTRSVASTTLGAKKLPKGEIGVVLLGRLAVALSAQGRGIGRTCLLRAMTQVLTAAQDIGIYALILDASDEEARTWYLRLKFGFEPSPEEPNRLILPITTIESLL